MAEWSEPFTKQRRFVMALSVAVVAYYALGANLKTEAEYAGFVVNIGRPGHFLWGLWILWGWAVLRYWQQVFARWEPIRTVILAEVSRRQARFTRKAAMQCAKELTSHGSFGKEWAESRVISTFLRQSNDEGSSWNWTDDSHIYFMDTSDGREFDNLAVEIERKEPSGDIGRKSVIFSMTWSKRKATFVRARSWISAFWQLPAIGEYVAPFALALLALAAPWLFPPVVQSVPPAP